MLNDIKTAARRSHATLVHDAVGAAALLVILLGGLALPALT